MASVEENLRYWETVYDWSGEGEEWSRGWGGTGPKWEATVYPRIKAFLPADTILEIAPGFGRWTSYLAEHCRRLIGVDLSSKCVEFCRARFPEAEFHTNDGRTLEPVADNSVDFVFSYFSLIHAEVDTVSSYLQEMARVLRAQGAAFLHHSNLGRYGTYFRRTAKLPELVRKGLFECGLLDLPQWRAPSMSAEVFAGCCREAGLVCITQETVNFGSRRMIDCFSTVVTPDHPFARETRVWENSGFMHEAMAVRLNPDRRPPLPAQFYDYPSIRRD